MLKILSGNNFKVNALSKLYLSAPGIITILAKFEVDSTILTCMLKSRFKSNLSITEGPTLNVRKHWSKKKFVRDARLDCY